MKNNNEEKQITIENNEEEKITIETNDEINIVEESVPWYKSFFKKLIGFGSIIGSIALYFFIKEKKSSDSDKKIEELKDNIEERNDEIEKIDEKIDLIEQEDEEKEKKEKEIELQKQKLNELLGINDNKLEDLKKEFNNLKSDNLKESIEFLENRYKK